MGMRPKVIGDDTEKMDQAQIGWKSGETPANKEKREFPKILVMQVKIRCS